MAEISQQYLPITERNRDQIVRVSKKLIQFRKSARLSALLEKIHAADLARIWKDYSDIEKSHIIPLISPEKGAVFLSELDTLQRGELIKSQNTDWIIDRLEELSPDDSVDILKDLPVREANFILKRFDRSHSQQIKDLMNYPEETAGALMTSEFFAVLSNATVESITAQFRKERELQEIEDIHFIYVVDKKNHLIGYIPLRKLILENPKKKAIDIMTPPLVAVHPEMDQEEVAKLFQNFDLISIPVITKENVLIGRITIDDIIDVLEEEASEDVYKMFGLNKEENFSNGIFLALRHRFPWMLINIFTTTLSALTIGIFTGIIEQFVVLALFMPMVAAIGGSTGNQMVAMVVRGLAIGNLHWRDIRWILIRDITTVILGSLALGSMVSLTCYLLFDNTMLGLVVAIAMLLNMIFATFVGASIPFILRSLKMDPAYGSSILVAASTDIMGFFIFLALASIVLIK